MNNWDALMLHIYKHGQNKTKTKCKNNMGVFQVVGWVEKLFSVKPEVVVKLITEEPDVFILLTKQNKQATLLGGLPLPTA